MFSSGKALLVVLLGTTSALSTLTVNPPSAPQSGAMTTITWTSSDATDPTFSIELTHPSFNQAIAIANNVDPTLDQITVELPIVPASKLSIPSTQDQYTLEFVNITNINQIFATSAQFSIAAAASPSLSATSAISTTPPSVVGTSTPVATSSGAFPSVTTPLIPTTAAATTSQSLSGAAISTRLGAIDVSVHDPERFELPCSVPRECNRRNNGTRHDPLHRGVGALSGYWPKNRNSTGLDLFRKFDSL
ncbi:hypothetical protein B0H14DRAFT_3510917 [Mycena olivaceomarginata]|nr:hypothetical protein B0H14DRAFT_3510917 [Mycena olivaceomarginata]